MIGNVCEAARAVELMDEYLRKSGKLREDQLWENNRFLNKRLKGDTFSLSDHIRAMVYSMLNAERGWAGVDVKIEQIDKIFYDFDPERLMNESPETLEDAVKDISCGNRLLGSHMRALKTNIEKLKSLESQNGSIDTYYQTLMGESASLKVVVRALSDYQSKDKLTGLGVPLVSEYLRNVGYDVPKPDRHIKRILGSRRLACSKKETVSEFEAFDIIARLAQETDRTSAEVDYILWAYCANGYGEVCTAIPNCAECVAKDFCKFL